MITNAYEEYDDEDEEEQKPQKNYNEEESNILDLCVIELRESDDEKLNENKEMNTAIYKALIHNLKSSLKKKKTKKNDKDEYGISMNYGYG